MLLVTVTLMELFRTTREIPNFSATDSMGNASANQEEEVSMFIGLYTYIDEKIVEYSNKP